MTTEIPSAGLRALYAERDWAATPLGDPAGWSPALRTALEMVLSTQFACILLWGDEFACLYNDAYIDVIGDKHPAALGERAVDVFPEAWHDIGPLMEGVLGGGPSFRIDEAHVPLHRRGFLEDCWFVYSYSPVAGPDGVEGVLDIVVEITPHVLTERRLSALTRLTTALVGVESRDELRRVARKLLADTPDLPAAEVRLPGGDPEAEPAGTDLPAAPPAGARPDEAGVVVAEVDGGRTAWLPLGTDGDDAQLVCRLSPRLPYDADYRDYLQLLATVVTEGLTRIELLASERARHEQERHLSLALQRSLLTPPAAVPGTEVAARYVPATETAQIGGDWFDAFPRDAHALVLTVGDIAGHDSEAAVTMAQARNIVRGVAFAVEDSPGRVLEVLDRALERLDVATVATAVVAHVDQAPSQVGTGRWTVRWSRAGHPPPVVLHPDGSTSLLDTGGELLLGVDASVPRADHVLLLEPGSALVLYTDGLVERRGETLDVGTDRLRATLTGRQDLDADALCDLLVDGLDVREDDVAVLVLRV
ncbi:serine/threonine-protein phosphatase [Nocardioides sp. ChNu-153]|uniref:PP2C family protein-serine/threonine phosphatase n=1 Tax=unclassified Nocardioides TaxID=2615069 RepID=UPI002404F38D|nr:MULTISPECIES: PP2C family protein-serine/threonine phosphatase [unclassified Nocardioides]MDF9716161.1 serine/threonine-protein phosphatase [Nocardioides sp. ChNu-99]MDN7121551.1 serine/threonine-protein phosphatase [Nocardioides sp. ChNu-153]